MSYDWDAPWRKLSREDVERIRVLRYRDGLTAQEVGTRYGVTEPTIRYYAPGWPGKVPTDRVRSLFESSPLTAADVARRLGWMLQRRSGHRCGQVCADGSRVLRALGLALESSRGRRGYRALIDAETAALIAEALGHAAWEAFEDTSPLTPTP